MEAALAHMVQNNVEPAYQCSDLFERRRGPMEDWAAYLSGEDAEGGVARFDVLTRCGRDWSRVYRKAVGILSHMPSWGDSAARGGWGRRGGRIGGDDESMMWP